MFAGIPPGAGDIIQPIGIRGALITGIRTGATTGTLIPIITRIIAIGIITGTIGTTISITVEYGRMHRRLTSESGKEATERHTRALT